MYKVIGIDEAGKGPVIGSMFIGFSIIILKDATDLDSFQKLLKDNGVKDSKKLAPKRRGEVFLKLKSLMDFKYAQLTPILIDKNFFSGGNLNELEVSSIIKILNQEKPDLIIIDALTSKPTEFGNRILKRLDFPSKIISENKADSKYEMVSAASIIAKQLREQEVLDIKINIKKDFGSGYPSDPKTKIFLKENFKNKDFEFIFRKSWKTFQNLSKIEKQKSIYDF